MSTTIQNNAPSQALLDAMNPKSSTAKSTAAEAQDRFMTLLVTQMKNQDPLNPLDNAQVTSQLAQLSTVTGIDKLNTSLEGLMGSYQTSQSLQAANMIGHGVIVPGSGVDLVQGQGLVGVELTEPADKVQITIYDASGLEVRKIDLNAPQVGTNLAAWDGKAADGSTAADGHYTFKVQAALGNNAITATALEFGVVSSVSTSAQGVKLSLPSRGDVNFTDVREIL
jgi:flagellar basal-body rod modification protein FlgD